MTKQLTVSLSAGSFLSAVFIAILVLALILQEGVLNIVSNKIAGIKICCGAVTMQTLALFFISLLHSSKKDGRWKDGVTASIYLRFSQIMKCCLVLLISSVVFHGTAVCFGAPFFESASETYHFAILMTVLVCLPCCLAVGPSLERWLSIFAQPSSEVDYETVVHITSICSLFGAWFGAVPIPLDWDRPWQEWPISCAVGAVLGYASGLLLASLYIPHKYRMLYKTKFL